MDELGLIIGLLVILLVGLPILVIVQFFSSRGRLNRLQQRLDRLQEQVHALQAGGAGTAQQSSAATGATSAEAAADRALADTETAGDTEFSQATQAADSTAAATAREDAVAAGLDPQPVATLQLQADTTDAQRETQAREKNPVDYFEDFARRIGGAITSYFTDGNLFVRIGILVLFCGVAFLLKFAADNSNLPLEFRFMAAAAGGLALLVSGWRLRLKKQVYGLLLQGGGIGVIYITIFAAFRLADLIPSGLTFALLVFFAAFTVALAILQDSRATAIYAVLGGFAAPFLASSGSGNWIGLFSYFCVLNAAVFAIAWFRAWRALNLLGFIFTFGVFILWVAFDYQSQDLWPAIAFLTVFFLMYSLIGVLYAWRQPQQLTGLVDGSLVFGTPVIVSGLMMVMLRHLDFAVAIASAALGFYYVLLARFAWRRVGEDFRMLAEAMLAIGVVFATLAIPYALEGHWSSAAWALEAAGILWVSIRQNRFYAQCFAIALQVGAGLLFLLRNIDDLGLEPWFNPAFLGGVFIALGAFISARMLYQQAAEFKLRWLHSPFYLWAMGWWLISALIQIEVYIDQSIIAWLLLFTLTAAALVSVDRLRGWNWMPASISAAALLPILVLIAIYALDANNGHLLTASEGYFWVAALAANYWFIEKLESVAWPQRINIAAHTCFVVFVSLLLSFELLWLFENRLDISGEGFYAVFAVVPLIAMRLAQTRRLPALQRHGERLQLSLLTVLGGLMMFWHLGLNFTNSGDATPLPYLPFFNPVDLSHIAFFAIAIGSLKILQAWTPSQRNQLLILLAGLAFVWLSAVLMRSMHHFMDIRFDLSAMSQDSRVQTAISILWTIIGMSGMWFASRRLLRPLWILGATLVGVVLVKMFFIDLGASGTIERIVSFLVVGSLLVATGYFSPIPERRKPAENHQESSAHA